MTGVEALVTLFSVDGFSEIFGVLCAIFILIGAWLPTRETKLTPTLIAIATVIVGQEIFRYLYLRSVARFYLLSHTVAFITVAAAVVMMSIGYLISDHRQNGESVTRDRLEAISAYAKEIQEEKEEPSTEGEENRRLYKQTQGT